MGGLRCPARRRARPAAADAGFTLVELLVAIMLIGIVMTALTSFFVSTMTITSQQGGKQAAVQLADDATERVRAMRGSSILAGRDQASSSNQWSNPVAGVAPHLAGMQLAFDPAAAFPAGATATLPTSPESNTVNKVRYDQHWYVGRCWQSTAGGDCGATQTAGSVEFFRVVLAVTWTANHCAGATCAYVTATLVSSAAGEPLFNPNPGAPPVVTNPGNQLGQATVAASLQLTATGGTAPLTWSGSGLPTGLSITSAGRISGTPTTPGSYAVTVVVTDGGGLDGTATFTWTINGPLVLFDPGDQSLALGAPFLLVMPVSGGTAPYAWSVRTPGPWGPTGLPPGLSLNPTTGVISGTPTAMGNLRHVDVSVTDRYGATATERFLWVVHTLRVAQPAAQASAVGTATSLQLTASGGGGSYTFAGLNLPPGLTMTSAGLISGAPTRGGRYLVTATVDDSWDQRHWVTFAWTVSVPAGGLQVTAPTGDRTGDRLGDAVSITGTADGGSGYTWTATGLPPGVTVDAAGAITGSVTRTGSYTVTLTVRDDASRQATFMFTWVVTC